MSRPCFQVGLAVALAVVALAGCARQSAIVTTATGLRYQVLVAGEGDPARPGQRVTIHETVTLRNGTPVFDSREKNTPITIQLGVNQVIAGLDEGVTGMRIGERRIFTIPPALSHRSSYPPNTPPDSTLVIDLEVLDILDP
ncbi:MAG: FKBP-type peptidyl-prolyl cis-trans isomerase [Rhodothermales bacterium]